MISFNTHNMPVVPGEKPPTPALPMAPNIDPKRTSSGSWDGVRGDGVQESNLPEDTVSVPSGPSDGVEGRSFIFEHGFHLAKPRTTPIHVFPALRIPPRLSPAMRLQCEISQRPENDDSTPGFRPRRGRSTGSTSEVKLWGVFWNQECARDEIADLPAMSRRHMPFAGRGRRVLRQPGRR